MSARLRMREAVERDEPLHRRCKTIRWRLEAPSALGDFASTHFLRGCMDAKEAERDFRPGNPAHWKVEEWTWICRRVSR